MSRLRKAVYHYKNDATEAYNEEMSYDKNGNIQSMLRNGAMDSQTQPQEIDDLAYTYHPQKKNQLMKVFDSSLSPEGFADDSDGITDPADDYAYDAFGNMVSDQNKGIINITYNHLNLPTKIVFGGETRKIEYLYTAAGAKVEKSVTSVEMEGTVTVTTLYLGGFQYKGKTLLFFPTAEGYVNYTPEASDGGLEITPESFNYVFNYTDHLGNIRLSYGIDPATNVLKIIEENHYYPFGLKHTKYNTDWNLYSKEDGGIKLRPGTPVEELSYKYKFGAKEWQDELSLNLYDFGARLYDPAIVRTLTPDPLAEKFTNISPYSFLNNNPLYFIDPTGISASPIYDYDGNFMGTDDEGFSGEVIFMDRTTFTLMGGYDNGTDDSKKGGISHEAAMALGVTINGVIGNDIKNTYTQGDADMINNAITHIISQMPEVNTSELLNGKVSSSYYEMDNGLPYGKSSNGALFRNGATADIRKTESGQSQISFYLDSFLNRDFTVANIQNTMVHEYSGHHKRGIPGSYGPEHAKAIDLQRSHPTWKNTTQNFKDNINYVYQYFMRKK